MTSNERKRIVIKQEYMQNCNFNVLKVLGDLYGRLNIKDGLHKRGSNESRINFELNIQKAADFLNLWLVIAKRLIRD